MGEPRLSDIAPGLAAKLPISSEPRRSNSLKNKTEFGDIHDDLFVHMLTSKGSAPLDVSDDEEVFLSEGSAHYYNFNANRRRHSIGTFMTRERTTSVASSSKSFKDDSITQAIVHSKLEEERTNPIMSTIAVDDHSLRHGSYPRKRCNRCTRGK